MAAVGSSREVISKVALIILDVQNSFTTGYWMSFVGEADVTRIRHVFDLAAERVHSLPHQVPLLISQCPFHGRSFELHPPFKQALEGRSYTHVIKPGNSILMAHGAIDWVEDVLAKGFRHLVLTGCTTNSCIRVSALHLCKYFAPKGLNVHVDLSLCGARDSNYIKRCAKCIQLYLATGQEPSCGRCESECGPLMSPVDLAVEEMTAAGANVYEQFDWSPVLSACEQSDADKKDSSKDNNSLEK